MEHYLFVYGTLRKGTEHAMSQYLNKNARWLGTGHVTGQLFRVSWYPGLKLTSTPSDKVVGDLFLLNSSEVLQRLDRYEDYDPNKPQYALFVRTKTLVSLPSQPEAIEAWVYEYNKEVVANERIASGDYLLEK